jgi:nucleotide-binding universal stress UspA family protein
MLHTILVPLDGSLLAEAALPSAEALARLTGARIILVRAIDLPDVLDDLAPPFAEEVAAGWPASDVDFAAGQREADDYLIAIARHLAQTGRTVETRLAPGPAATAIVEAARDTDLVVMATHGRSGLSRWALGSVADTVVQTVPAPVLLVRAEQAQPLASGYPRHILVPLDGSMLAEQALPLAVLLASRSGAELILTHIVTQPPTEPVAAGDDELAELIRESARAYLFAAGQRAMRPGITLHTDIHAGRAAEGILAAADSRHADLIVMATHGRSGLVRWISGSVADQVLRGASVPVLLVRAHAWQPAPATARSPLGARG